MTKVRAEKIEGVSQGIPLQDVASGPNSGKLAVIGWGSTYGAIEEAVKTANTEGLNVAHIHLRYINPMPKNMGELLSQYENVLIPEMNSGQLLNIIRSKFLVPAEAGPFSVAAPGRVSSFCGSSRALLLFVNDMGTHGPCRAHHVAGIRRFSRGTTLHLVGELDDLQEVERERLARRSFRGTPDCNNESAAFAHSYGLDASLSLRVL